MPKKIFSIDWYHLFFGNKESSKFFQHTDTSLIPVDMKRNKVFNQEPDFYTMNDVCRILGVEKQTLYNWISQRKISFKKFGRETRFEKKDIDEFILKNHLSAVDTIEDDEN